MSVLAGLTDIIVPFLGMILMVGVGVLAAWQGLLNQERITILSEIVIVLILPIFTFWTAATNSVAAILNQAPWMVGLGLCSGLIGYGLATVFAWFARWEWPQRSVLQVSGVSGNTGFLGIPVCTALYGSQGTILAVLFDLGASIYLLTLGLSVYQNNVQGHASAQERFRLVIKQLVNPIFIALILGMGLSLAGWQLPTVLQMPFESLSYTAIPLMMIILGGIIYNSALQYSADKRSVILLSFLKLIIMPGLIWLVVQLLPITGTPRGVAVIEAAMPSAVMAVTFASRYKADEKLAASATTITTLLSILTLPIFAAIVH
ncbi:MAG: AEC family transporter [Chloroflexi bacterium]|nr:AEC family transporter [Chloroflexota bacterium]